MNPNYDQTRSYGFTRFMIKVSVIIGMIIMLILAIYYFYMIGKYNSSETFRQANKDFAPVALNSYKQITSPAIIIFIAAIWTTVKTIVCGVGLYKYAKSPDSEFLANKWSLAVLSLSIGGMFIPFFISWLPNIDVKSTKNARVAIVRYMGLSWMIGAIGVVIGLAGLYGSIPNGSDNAVWTGNSKGIFSIMIGIFALVFILNLIFATPFLNRNVEAHLAADTAKARYYRVIAAVYTVIITIELIFQIILSILKVLAAFSRAFSGENWFDRIINFMNAFFTAAAAIFMITLIVAVIHGLWRRENKGYIEFKVYQKKEEQKNTPMMKI